MDKEPTYERASVLIRIDINLINPLNFEFYPKITVHQDGKNSLSYELSLLALKLHGKSN